MKNIIRWFILNTVAANLLMVFIIIAGIFTLSRLRMEVFPDITIPIINVSVVYPGASPEDIEELVNKIKKSKRIELPNCGHLIPLEEPEQFSDHIINFANNLINS